MGGMAGFDLIFEVSPRALAELLRPQLTIEGVSYDPPFEITQPMPDADGGELHLVITALDVSVRPGAAISLRFSFERGSLVGRRGLGAALTGLRGTVTINARLTLDLVPMQPTLRVLTLHLRRIERGGMVVDTGADVQVRMTSNGWLAALLGAGLAQVINGVMTNPAVMLPLQVNPDARGGISPPVFRDLRLGSVAAEGGQSLVFFANLLPGPAARGDTALWDTTSLAPEDDTSLLISPQLFHELVFVPQVQTALRVAEPAFLPRTCGLAESVPYPALPEWSITRVADIMRDGRIDVHIRARHARAEEGDAFGVTHLLDVHGALTLEVRPPNLLLPRWRVESVHGGEHFGWGTWLLGILALPLLGVMGIAALATELGAAGAASSFALSPDPIAVPALLPAVLRSAEIAAERLRITATVSRAPRRSAVPTLWINPTLAESKRLVLESGVYESTGCPEGRYLWQRTQRRQTFTCTPLVRLAALPVRYQWSIGPVRGGPPRPLADSEGVVEHETECYMPDSIPARRVVRSIRIDYSITPEGVLTLRNRPEDGVFHVWVVCTATAFDGHRMEQQAHFDFAGDQIALGDREDGSGTWGADFEACVRHIGMRMGTAPRMPGGMSDLMQLPHWVLAHRPPPDELAAYLAAMDREVNSQISKLSLEHAATLFGPSMLAYIPALTAQFARASPDEKPGALGSDVIKK